MMDDTDLTDHHGEAEALRKENERLRSDLAAMTADRDKWFEGAGAHHVASMREAQRADQNLVRAEAAEAALAAMTADRDKWSAENAKNLRKLVAASRAPDPVVNAGSCQTGDMISRAAAIEALAKVTPYKRVRGDAGYSDVMCPRADGLWQNRKEAQAAIRALPAAPVAKAQPTIGWAELDALVRKLRAEWPVGPGNRVACQIMDEAADAITALRAQPDWKAMAERLAKALSDANETFAGVADHILERKNTPLRIDWPCVFADCQRGGIAARAALSDLAKMKDANK